MLAWVTNPTSYAPALRWVTIRNGAIIDERCGTRWAAHRPADQGHPDQETDAALASIYQRRALPAMTVEARKSIITAAREWLAQKVAP